MFSIKKKKSSIQSANSVPKSEVPSTNKINPGEFSAKANLKALKKSGSPSASIEAVGAKSFKGADKIEGSELEVKSNSAYEDRIKRRAKKL